ncbi:unnamed protein product [Arabidopsis lyrata]|nr:unnamed protein product [Arabidopsis lyrata]
MMSDSKAFLCAVEEDVREIGEHVEQFLVCDDAASVSSIALNSGILEGISVPDVRREIISSLVLENHGVVLEDVKRLVKTISLRLEYKVDESYQRSLTKCSGFARKKRKFGNEANLGDVATTGSTTFSKVSKIENAKEEISNGKSLSSRKRNSKRGLNYNNDDGIGKREESKDSNHLEESEKKDDSCIEIGVDLGTPLASICKRLKVYVSSSVKRSNGNGETVKRERKKSKYLS